MTVTALAATTARVQDKSECNFCRCQRCSQSYYNLGYEMNVHAAPPTQLPTAKHMLLAYADQTTTMSLQTLIADAAVTHSTRHAFLASTLGASFPQASIPQASKYPHKGPRDGKQVQGTTVSVMCAHRNVSISLRFHNQACCCLRHFQHHWLQL